MITLRNLPRMGRFSVTQRWDEIRHAINGIISYISSDLANFEFNFWDMRSKNGNFRKQYYPNKSKNFHTNQLNNNLDKWSMWKSYSYRRGTKTLREVITRLWKLIGSLNLDILGLSTTKMHIWEVLAGHRKFHRRGVLTKQ